MTRSTIGLSPRGALMYQLLTLAATALPLYALASLLLALYQAPGNPLPDWIDEFALRSLRGRLFDLVALTGLVAFGARLAGESLCGRRLHLWRWLWLSFAFGGVIAAPLTSELLLDLAAACVLLALLLSSVNARQTGLYWRVWQLGLLLIAGSLLAAHLGQGAVAAAISAFRLHIAYGLSALGLVFWLLGRLSAVDSAWRAQGLRIATVMLMLGGGLISLGRLGLPPLIALSAAPLILLSYVILAAHIARALRNRNTDASLAPHWLALASLLWLVGAGCLGALSIQPGINQAMRGTDLTEAQRWLAEWVVLALALAAVNEGACALRGDNRRVTGYAPFWLIAFGVPLAAVVLLCRGVAQLYLREVASMTPTAEHLLPLTLVWIICLAAVSLGALWYAIGFWLRRPRIRIVRD